MRPRYVRRVIRYEPLPTASAPPDSADVVVCGAGIVGVSTAHRLAERLGVKRVVLVDSREPLTLTSDKGTQAYRNWFDGPDDAMVRLVNRSLDLIEEVSDETGDAIGLTRYGYLFATADAARAREMVEQAGRLERLGAGARRVHENGDGGYSPTAHAGWRGVPDGADVLLDRETMRRHFPFVRDDVAAMLHVRRAGWLDALALGRWLLARAVGAGATLVNDRVAGVRVENGHVRGVRLASGVEIATERVVFAAGPELPRALEMLGVDLPLLHELHGKMAFSDPLGVIPRDAPMTIWTDPVRLEWSDEERARLATEPGGERLLGDLPGGVHMRPKDDEHGDTVLAIWTYDDDPCPYVWPPSFPPSYGEALMRGLACAIPGLAAYERRVPPGYVDGGYYCKTPENRPLLGPAGPEGVVLAGAVSGYGVMSSQGAAELAALHATGGTLPQHARSFLPSRYEDAEYRARALGADGRVGQL